ncbi:MAG: orotate phosphoribosyltransferase [Parerythrobacter sp.]
MKHADVLTLFRDCGALLEGHFRLSSGRHSAHYLQCARVLMDAARAGQIARAMAAKLPHALRAEIDIVVSPAMGGVVIGHEMGRALEKDAVFLERPDGTFQLRRGFALPKGARVLMVEDVVTTGLSSREAIAAVAQEGGEVIAETAIVDRSGGEADLGVPFFPLIELTFPTYADGDVPEELARVPVTRPGSRS